jgi:hypothetical protein
MVDAQDEPQNAPKKTSGCMIVFGVLIFLSLIVIGVVGIGFYKLISSPEGKAVFKTMQVTTDLVIEMSAGQGVSAMRQMGCQQAMSVTPKKVLETLQTLEQETGNSIQGNIPSIPEEGQEQPILICAIQDDNTELTCKKLVRGYRQAVSKREGHVSVIIATFEPLDPFSVARERHQCSGVFDKDGARVADLPPSFFLLGQLTDNYTDGHLSEASPDASQPMAANNTDAIAAAGDQAGEQRAGRQDGGPNAAIPPPVQQAASASPDGGRATPSQP